MLGFCGQVGGKTVAGVFAFRGTQPWSLSDWIIDFNYDKEPIDWWQPPPTAAPSSHVSEVPNGVHSDDCKTCGPQARPLKSSSQPAQGNAHPFGMPWWPP